MENLWREASEGEPFFLARYLPCEFQQFNHSLIIWERCKEKALTAIIAAFQLIPKKGIGDAPCFFVGAFSCHPRKNVFSCLLLDDFGSAVVVGNGIFPLDLSADFDTIHELSLPVSWSANLSNGVLRHQLTTPIPQGSFAYEHTWIGKISVLAFAPRHTVKALDIGESGDETGKGIGIALNIKFELANRYFRKTLFRCCRDIGNPDAFFSVLKAIAPLRQSVFDISCKMVIVVSVDAQDLGYFLSAIKAFFQL